MASLYRFLTETLGDWIWQGVFLPCVLLAGIVFTVRCRGMQFFRFFTVLKEVFGRLFEKKKADSCGVTPFQAMCTALAGTVGTGSVVGTCQALAFGGPGALFWLWVAALFGMIIKYFEVVLAVVFRKKEKEGDWVGGPMYYITRGMGKQWKPMATVYAAFALLSSLGMGCLAQANSVSSGVKSVALALGSDGSASGRQVEVWVALCLGVILSVALFGGVKRIGRVAEILIPVMSVFYLFVTVWVLFCYRSQLLGTLSLVAKSAFSAKPIIGAASGIGMKQALAWGLKRSAFSNEAGLGSAAIAHASADTNHPVRQGFFGIFEVFADTLVICSLTGIAILVALPEEQIFASASCDSTLIIEAVGNVFGSAFANLFVGTSLALFAFSTLLGWSVYGMRCARFLFGTSAQKPYLFVYVFFSCLGSFLAMEPVLALSDLFNALMSIPNFIALFALSGTVCRLTQSFFQKNEKTSRKKV